MEFASAYTQESDILLELLGDNRDVYRQHHFDGGYDAQKVENLYSEVSDMITDGDDMDGYGTADETYSSGDEISNTIPIGGYALETTDDHIDDVDSIKSSESEEPELPVGNEKSTLNLRSPGYASKGLSRAVSVPVVNLKYESTQFQKKDWNKNFQAIMALEESEAKYQKLSQIAHEFIFVAETYGKVIISEINVPVAEKTIRPISIGGQAGGEKYIAQGILFKFALDVGNLYGGNDEYAQKAAGHDLKGLIQYNLANITGLHFPLMSLIHYMGYCLIAMSLLPIGKDSLKYGSADAGKTMHFDVPAINAKMKAAGEALNLKGHIAGFSKYQANLCYGPGDIECHLGKDGRFYVLDFARTFPPEAILPNIIPQRGQILFKLLRPELVRSSKVPLSSDAFTGFGMSDPAHKTHNREVTEATERLFVEVIPNLAKRVKENKTNITTKDGALIKEIHKEGINVRHIGNFRRMLVGNETHYHCLIEMIARVVKNKLKRQWRAITKVNQHITEEQCKQVTVVMLNKLYSDSEMADKFWQEKIPKYLKRKFRYALFKDEKGNDLRTLHKYKDWIAKDLLTRLQQLTGIVLSQTAWYDFKGFKSITFVHSDVEKINAVVKNMHIVEVADNQLLLWNGIKSTGSEAERIFSLALQKFEQNSYLMTLQINKMLKLVYQLYQKAKRDTKSISTDLAKKLLDVVIKLQPKTETAYILYGKLLNIGGHSNDQAMAQLRAGLEQIPDSCSLHMEYLKKSVQWQYEQASTAVGDATLEEYKTHFEAACREGFTKGQAYNYYAGFLLLTQPERLDEAIELIKVGQSLMPQKFESVLKLIVKRCFYQKHYFDKPFEILAAIQPLVPLALYSTMDKLTELTTKFDVDDRVLKMACLMLEKLECIAFERNDRVSTPAVVELVKSRGKTLKNVILKEFNNFPPEFVDLLRSCAGLVELSLQKTNLTITDILRILENVKLSILTIPAIDIQIDSILKVVSYTSIKDLNISGAVLSTDEMSVLLDQTNVHRLFLDDIATLTTAQVKTYINRNRELVCLSVKKTPVSERELMEHLPELGHATLQVVLLPSGTKRLAFSGAFDWIASFMVHKHPGGSRIEIKVACATPNGATDPEFPTFLNMTVNSVNNASSAMVMCRSDTESIASMLDSPMTRVMNFYGLVDARNDRFPFGTVTMTGTQSTVHFFKRSESPQIFNIYQFFGLSITPNFANQGQIRIPPRKDVTFLLPFATAFMMKKKSTL